MNENSSENIKIDCLEEDCFFSSEENKHPEVCRWCIRNKSAEKVDDDYKTVLQKNGY